MEFDRASLGGQREQAAAMKNSGGAFASLLAVSALANRPTIDLRSRDIKSPTPTEGSSPAAMRGRDCAPRSSDQMTFECVIPALTLRQIHLTTQLNFLGSRPPRANQYVQRPNRWSQENCGGVGLEAHSFAYRGFETAIDECHRPRAQPPFRRAIHFGGRSTHLEAHDDARIPRRPDPRKPLSAEAQRPQRQALE
jgi:hypothetical protein